MVTTMGARLGLTLGFLFCSASAAASGPLVTESEAVRLFLEHSPQAARVPLIEASAGADARIAALLPNPEVAYETEEAGGVHDEFVTFRQELPVGGRRGFLRRSAEAAGSAAMLLAGRELEATATDVRRSFYEILYREEVLGRLTDGRGRVERIVEILSRREREGESSGYDLIRTEQELAGIGISVGEAEAAVSAARSRFGSFFDPALEMAAARLTGDFRSPATAPESTQAIDRALARRGDLLALRAEARRAEFERQAQGRRKFPQPTLTAGWKRTEVAGVDETGFVASVGVPLPLFDRGQVAAARAEADGKRAELDAEILARTIRAEVEAALALEESARRAVGRYGDAVERAEELRRIADLAYEEGEAGILDLLDAYRTSLETELRSLALHHGLKRAEIDRDHAIGGEVIP